jgi:hypothetical protein
MNGSSRSKLQCSKLPNGLLNATSGPLPNYKSPAPFQESMPLKPPTSSDPSTGYRVYPGAIHTPKPNLVTDQKIKVYRCLLPGLTQLEHLSVTGNPPSRIHSSRI